MAKRVIFVTGDVAGTDAEKFLEDCGCRWLAKPFLLADLLHDQRSPNVAGPGHHKRTRYTQVS